MSTTGSEPMRVLVAVHGIGDQTEFGTLQQLVNLCLGQIGLPRGVPIGKLHSKLRPPAADQPAWAELAALPGLGFAEVFWADIGRQSEQYRLEEPVRWVDTIVQRLDVIDNRVPAAAASGPSFDPQRVQYVLQDIAQCIHLARLLNRGLTMLGIGSVDLDQALVRYLGDIQLFAEFAAMRADIMARFHEVLRKVHAAAADRPLEIHVCAHSQGSVVAFVGLLEACAWQSGWLEHVHSFITIGSPIDKFLILWPELFAPFVGSGKGDLRGIRWRNYADLGDPVGYELDTASAYWPLVHPRLFAAGAPVDHLFRRYVVPGKAHVDYWNDQGVFAEWLVQDVRQRGPVIVPGNSLLALLLAPLLPFALPLAFAWAAAHSIGAAIQAIDPTAVFDLPRVASTAVLIHGAVALSGARHVSTRLFWTVIGALLFGAGAAATIAAFSTFHRWAAIVAVGILLLGALLQFTIDLLRQADTGLSRPRGRGQRRVITWITIAVVVAATFAIVTYGRPAGEVFAQGLLVSIGILCWAFAVLTWDLAVVWIDYVSRSRHLELLRSHWRIPGRRSAAAATADGADARPLPPKAHVAAASSAPRTGVWWLDPPDPQPIGSTPWWVSGAVRGDPRPPFHA